MITVKDRLAEYPGEIEVLLEKMQTSGHVDPSIITKIDQLTNVIAGVEKSSLTKGRPTGDDFALYHAARNSLLFLNKAKERFMQREVAHDNPKVVDDSLEVWPSFRALYDAICYATSAGSVSETRFLLLERVDDLRSTAMQAKMFPTLDEEKKGLDPAKISTGIGVIAETIRELIGD